MTAREIEIPAGIESHRLKIGSEHVFYLKAGSGPPLLLLHGGASGSADWIGTMTALRSRYALYAPDLIGFGRSDRNREGYYLSDFVDSVMAFMEELAIQTPVMVGHSFGGRICLEIAAHFPEKLSKLVLVDSAGLGGVSLFGGLLLRAFWLIRRLFHIPQPFPTFLTRPGEDTNWLCVDRLSDVQVPTLIVWKHYDPYFPLAEGRRASELIPRARLVVMPGYGHAPHGRNTRAFVRALADFVDGDEGRQTG